MAERILLCLCHMSGNERKYVDEALNSNGIKPFGTDIEGFEEDLRRWLVSSNGDMQVVALSTGTAAMHLALSALGVTEGDEVICQSFTFCASCNPVAYLGATPVFVDSESESWNMDPVLLEQAIIDRHRITGHYPKAIIVVYLYGMPAKIDQIMAIANKYDIPVIEDAAEGLGSKYSGQSCGTFGEFGILSFNGNKMITTSGGGALICRNESMKKRILTLASHTSENVLPMDFAEIGFNYRMSNICAAIGRGQMAIIDQHIQHHRHIAQLYSQLFADVEGINVHLNPTPDFDSNYWLNTITLSPDLHIIGEDKAYSQVIRNTVGGAAGVAHIAKSAHTECEPNTNVEALRMILDAANIESRPLWKPMHLQPIYANAPAYTQGVCESLFRVGLCLPSGPYVTDENVKFIVDTIKNSIVH